MRVPTEHALRISRHYMGLMVQMPPPLHCRLFMAHPEEIVLLLRVEHTHSLRHALRDEVASARNLLLLQVEQSGRGSTIAQRSAEKRERGRARMALAARAGEAPRSARLALKVRLLLRLSGSWEW